MKIAKLVLASLAASLAASLPFPMVLVHGLLSLCRHQATDASAQKLCTASSLFSTFWGGALASFIYAIPHAFFLGIPLYLIANKLNWVRCWSAMLAGMIVGVMPMACHAFYYDIDPLNTLLADIQFLAPCGIVGGLVFWLVMRNTVSRT